MLTKFIFVSLIVSRIGADLDGEEERSPSSGSFIDLYERGVQSYLSNEYQDCIYFLEIALDKYRNYYEATANCRIECDYENRDVKNKGNFLHPTDIENLHFYELILKRTLCLTKCRKRNANYLPFEDDFDGYFMAIFKNRRAYEYLHACYAQTNQVTLAASAALTYMIKHPGDTVMQKNFERAIEKPGVDKDEIIDLEEKKFVKLFISGILAINDKDWDHVISLMESSVMQFIFDENQCRAYCEGEFDHGFLPDFVSSIGNHFTNTLYCKRNCTREMGMVRGKYYETLFAGHYQYLQLAYYETKKYEESYRTGLSYLLFNKDDPDMLGNLKVIEKETKGILNDNFFKVRREAAEYNDRNIYEEKLLAFINDEFNNLDNRIDDISDNNSNDHHLDEKVNVKHEDDDTAEYSENEVDQNTINEDMIYQTTSSGYQRDEL